MENRPFGARFIDEMRRLSNSTWGLEYGVMQRLAQMDRGEFMATIGPQVPPPDGPDRDAAEPEELARAVVERRRSSDLLGDVVNILGGLV
jgi:hypothetical protein